MSNILQSLNRTIIAGFILSIIFFILLLMIWPGSSSWFSDKYFLDQFDHKNLDKLKIFIGNGIQDQRINIDMARDSVKNLSSLGTKPHYKEYNCDHTIPNECLVDILEWIKK